MRLAWKAIEKFSFLPRDATPNDEEHHHPAWSAKILREILDRSSAINYRRTSRFYRRFHVGVRDGSRLCAFNTRWRGTFLARCNRMMIRYWPLTTHATLRGNSLLCGRLIRRENERWKCNDEKGEKEERGERKKDSCMYILAKLVLVTGRRERWSFFFFFERILNWNNDRTLKSGSIDN